MHQSKVGAQSSTAIVAVYNSSNQTWVEFTCNPNCLAAQELYNMPKSPTLNTTAVSTTINTTWAWNVTSAIIGAFDSGLKNITFVFNSSDYSSTGNFMSYNNPRNLIGTSDSESGIDETHSFNSSEAPTYKPYLNVTYNLTQSKVVNNGPHLASIFLQQKVQHWNVVAQQWRDDDVVLDDTSIRTISAAAGNNVLKLDSLFNGKWNTSMACCGAGTYRVYVAVTDEQNLIQKNYDGKVLEEAYNFTIS